MIEPMSDTIHTDQQRPTAALTGITAAVVGVIANLAVFFATHTLFASTTTVEAGPLYLTLPRLDSLQPVALGITAIAVVLVFGLKWSMLRVLAGCAALGAAAAVIGLPVG